MKRIYLFLLLLIGSWQMINAKITFTVEGPKESYNQVKIINETSVDSLHLRVVKLNLDGTNESVFGVYYINGRGADDTKTTNDNRIQRGKQLAIELPKDFPVELSCFAEYRTFPLFQMIIIHLHDKDKGFE